MKTPLGWYNLLHRKTRTFSALAGVAMAILLVFLQVGFYRAAKRGSVMLLNQFSHQVVIFSQQYVFLGDAGSIKRERLFQALAVDGVARGSPFYHGLAQWRNLDTGVKREVVVVGIDPASPTFGDAKVNRLLPLIAELDASILDRKTGHGYDSFEAGTITEIDGHRIEVVGDYTHGLGFSGNAVTIVSDLTFSRIFDDPPLSQPTLGLLWLDQEADPTRVVADLRTALPNDVQVMTREEQFAIDCDFIMNEKPVGIIFVTGLILALVVGAVILYQILSSEVANHLPEYATLKAIGYSPLRVYFIVWQQAVLFAVFGYLPALLAGYGVYALIAATTTMPTEMTLDTILTVFVLSVVMCCLAGFLAVRKVDRADPADLF